jgi:predicted enzyme related to lactoylglutathione lyase
MSDDLAHLVNVRYMVDDVDAAIDFYTKHLGFTVRTSAAPAFADVVRGNLRLLLSGPRSSAGRPMPDGTVPVPGGWNRIHLIVSDIAAEVERYRAVPTRWRMNAAGWASCEPGRYLAAVSSRVGPGGLRAAATKQLSASRDGTWRRCRPEDGNAMAVSSAGRQII